MSNYENAFRIIIGHEGGFTDDRRDRGNWTSGKIGVGQLKGTKYGIAAHAYPSLDIRNLTLQDARAIYKRDYWDRINADDLSAPLALAAFDAAVNSGVGAAKRWLAQCGGDWRRLIDLRFAFMQSLSIWPIYAKGWTTRINTLRRQCAELESAAAEIKVFLTDTNGTRALWDGKPTLYAGVNIVPGWPEQMHLVYPTAGTYTSGQLEITRAADGALILNRIPTAPAPAPKAGIQVTAVDAGGQLVTVNAPQFIYNNTLVTIGENSVKLERKAP